MRPHGYYSRYSSAGCRCEPCVRAARRYEKQRHLRRLQQGPLMVDPAPLRAHVARLRASGMSLEEIARAAGYPGQNWIRPAVYTSKRVLLRTEARIFAVQPEPGYGAIDATGSRRRLQALGSMGHTLRAIGVECGIGAPLLSMIRTGELQHTRAVTAERIKAAYDALAMIDGGSSRARFHARKHGWQPPLAWDDDEIDDPQATPQTPEDERSHRGRPLQYLLEDWHDTWDHHQGDLRIAAPRLGMTTEALYQQLRRASRDGVEVQFFGQRSA